MAVGAESSFRPDFRGFAYLDKMVPPAMGWRGKNTFLLGSHMVMMKAYSQKKKVLKSQIFSCQNLQKREFHAQDQKGACPLRH